MEELLATWVIRGDRVEESVGDDEQVRGFGGGESADDSFDGGFVAVWSAEAVLETGKGEGGSGGVWVD